MERHAQQGSNGRWYVREGYKVVAGPYEEVLAKRLVATWNARQARQAQQELPATMPVVRSTAPARQQARVARRRAQEAPRRPEEARVDERLVHWYGELLMEHENDVEATWRELVELNEGWDGEPELVAAARATFDRTIPHSLAQNAAIQWANRARRPR